ncbi:MAG: beta-ketoacyl synthase [Bacteroidales bacterium]|nr:beta-ketoacyl synthase [Bacteroidales bacterium]
MIAIGDCIISSFGIGSAINYEAVAQGKSSLELHHDFELNEPFFASLLDTEFIDFEYNKIIHKSQNISKLEKITILAATQAINEAQIDASQNDVLFIFSSTKGNVHLLEENTTTPNNQLYIWHTAHIIAQHFHNPNPPLVVSNACISGLVAQIYAQRMLATQKYRYVVVVGGDILSKFIVSGFQSFKSLSTTCCKPFDKDRCGLNLGEAAACIVYTNNTTAQGKWQFLGGNIANDANHISGPSRTGEGLLTAINKTIKDCDTDDIAFINAHGTATLYNDDMESIAITRAGLNKLGTNSLKAYFGHTLGTAGILECIISAFALSNNRIIPSKGCQNIGTVEPINIIQQPQITDKKYFLKLMSGFGGCNAAGLIEINRKSND